MPRYNKTKVAKAENLEEFAKALRSFAEEHEQLAAKLRQTGFGDLELPLLPTAQDGMDNLSRFLGQAMRAYLDGISRRGLSWAAEGSSPLIPAKVQQLTEEAAKAKIQPVIEEPAKKRKRARHE